MAKWFFFKNKEANSASTDIAQNIQRNALKSIENSKKQNARQYAGAVVNRLTAGWSASVTSMDAEIRGSLRALRNRSRDLARNNDYVRQLLRAVENNVIGQGIPFQAQVKKAKSNELDKEINKAIEREWNDWTKKEYCHTSGRLSFPDIERLLIRSTAESGEVFVRMIKKSFGGSKIPFALEIIEADLLDEDRNGISESGNMVRMGVELDEFQRPLAYYFRKRHPGDLNAPSNQGNSYELMKIPASEIIALFKTERPGKTRGVPWLASSIIRLHHVQGYEEATVIQKRAESSLMGFIETPDGEIHGDDVDGYDRVTDFEPGVFKHLAPGEKVNVPNIGKSAGEFDPFMRSMLRAFAAGVGVSYETLSRDYSQSNYSSSRLALIDDRDNWRVLQSWMIENFHQIVFKNWLEMAVLSGVLKLPLYELDPKRYEDIRWMPRGWAWVDPAKEVAAYKEALRGGFTTLSDVIAQNGNDFEEVMFQRQKENEVIRDLGLVFDSDAAVTENKSVNNSGSDGQPGNSQE